MREYIWVVAVELEYEGPVREDFHKTRDGAQEKYGQLSELYQGKPGYSVWMDSVKLED